MGRKGQSSVELLIILSMVLVILAFIYIASHQQVTESEAQLRVSQAKLTVSRIAAAAREVYSEGPGSVRVVTVTIPDANIAARTGVFNESVINIGLYLAAGSSDVNEKVGFRVVEGANFPKSPGTYSINIRAYEGYVMAGDPSYTVLPGTVAFQMLPTASSTQVLNVTNHGNSSLTINLSLSWSNAGTSANINGSGTMSFVLASNASVLVNANFATSNASFGTYTGTVNAKGSDFQNQTVSLILQVVGAQPPIPTGVSYILIDTFSDSGYTNATSTFDPTETVDLHGTNFAPSSLVSVTIRNSTGSVVHSGSNTSDGSGNVTYYWNPGVVYAGTYNATMNDSTKLNSTTFGITGCP